MKTELVTTRRNSRTMRTSKFRFWHALIVAIPVVYFSGLGQSRWVELESTNHKFTASFPAPPGKTVHALQTPLGKLDITQYTSYGEGLDFCVAVLDYPLDFVNAVGPQVILDGLAAEGAAKSPLVSRNVTKVGNHTGMELEFSVLSGDGRIRATCVLASNRLYRAIVTGPAGLSHSKQARKFLESFSIQ